MHAAGERTVGTSDRLPRTAEKFHRVARDRSLRPPRYGTTVMQRFRGAYVVGLATLAGVASGCAAGGDTADGPNNSQTVVVDEVGLDGVRFDVRRDPG